jgi:hypothetical protein
MRQQNICRLDIAVQNAQAVGVIQPRENICNNRDGPFGSEGDPLRITLASVSPFTNSITMKNSSPSRKKE